MRPDPVATATLSTRRQATFPAAACEALNLKPGDTVVFERRVVDGEPVWIMLTPEPDWSWFGGARAYAQGKSHDMVDIRQSVARGRSR
jgi:bifunctional DNA-binding transcriptional regulator/antitoxin component of YhaV-PrlF toxin-antitoxin module